MTALVLNAGLVAASTGGEVILGSPDQAFTAVSTDSRSLTAGTLFVALVGDRFDGHAFVEDAIRRGAAGLVVSRDSARRAVERNVDAGSVPAVIVVPDTLVALQDLGREIRRRSGAKVVAITGSAGKTTTKELTADLLATRFRVYRNRGNLNNHIGLPLSLTELVDAPDVAVVELGMNHAGEIRTLVGIAEPDLRVWINVGDAHIGHFGSRDAVAAAKAEILEGATAADVIVANADDALVMCARQSRRRPRHHVRHPRRRDRARVRHRRPRVCGNDGRGRDAGRRAAPGRGATRTRTAHERARCRRRGDRIRRAGPRD